MENVAKMCPRRAVGHFGYTASCWVGVSGGAGGGGAVTCSTRLSYRGSASCWTVRHGFGETGGPGTITHLPIYPSQPILDGMTAAFEAFEATDIEVTADTRARLPFGRFGVHHADRFLVSRRGNEFLLTPMASIPQRELLVWQNAQVRASLQRGLADLAAGRVETLDYPPAADEDE